METLRNQLRALGYDASIANGDCFDIRQGGRIHYLSQEEAKSLLKAGAHPLDLMAFAVLPNSPRPRYDFSTAVPDWIVRAAKRVHDAYEASYWIAQTNTPKIIWEEFPKKE